MNELLDQATTVDEKLGRIEQLLESQLAQEGVTEVRTAPNPTPFEYSSVPSEGERVTLPPGETTIDFQNGDVTNQWEGNIATVRDFDDMSQGIDSQVQSLRSLWLHADAPAQVQLDGGEWFTVDPGTFHPLVSQGFRKATIQTDYPLELTAVGSTRAKPFTDSDSVRTHITRRTDGRNTSAAPDSFEAVEWSTDAAFRNDDNDLEGNDWDQSYGKREVFVAPCEHSTVVVENDSGAANDMDVRLRAAATDSQRDGLTVGSTTVGFQEIARQTNLSQGDHHVFQIDQSHRWMRLEYRNSTNGNNVDVKGTLHGVI